mmetsp:Transcript_46786/g.151930  ORF Transcript_46786/g.151930 Transcript_46786/m.151930 type:complete len:368 (-) Transcript_46786:51-1154(-)
MMWRDALRRATRLAPPLAASAAAIAAQSHVHAQEAKQPVRQRTAADPEEDRLFAVSSNGWMLQCDDGGHLVTCFPNYVPAARDLRQNFSLREGDIVIATYPKCGTTWTQQVVMLLLAQGEKELVQRPTSLAPWLELNHAMRTDMLAYEPPEEWRKQGPAAGRRVFKTHAVAALAPWRGGATEEGIPRGAGVIVVTRNPKDAAVSYFHHGRDTVQYRYTGDWAHFLHAIFLPGLVDFGDFWSWHGTWWRARAKLPPDRLLWISYEEMQADLPAVVRRIAAFVGVPATEEVVRAVVAGASFGIMRKDWSALEQEQLQQTGVVTKKNHVRQGRSGAWREAMSEADSDAIDAAHAARCRAEGLPSSLWETP